MPIVANEMKLEKRSSCPRGPKRREKPSTSRRFPTTEPVNDHVRLWVQDNGIGVPPEYQHRLFKMFDRLHPELKYEGTGVGLGIVKKAVERMGGRVGMESDGINGSRFWIEIRATDNPSGAGAAAEVDARR